MEFNLKAWRSGLIFSVVQAFIVVFTNLMVMKEPPSWWQFVVLIICPAGLTFLTTIIQKCLPSTTTGVKP